MICPQNSAALRAAVPGSARLDLLPRVNAPVADGPARRVLVDYLKDGDLRRAA